MEEILYVVSGTAEQWIEKERQILKAGDSAHIPKGLVHGTFNAGDDDLVFLAILSPADTDGPMTVDRSQEEPWKSLRQAD
jgi:quercetin dioxygenase-like cupin family protein